MKRSLDRKWTDSGTGELRQDKKGNQEPRAQEAVCQPAVSSGFIIFIVILVMCLGAPLFTQYSATKVDLRNILSRPPHPTYLGPTRLEGIYGPGSSMGAVSPSGWDWEAPLWPLCWAYHWVPWQVIRRLV